MSRIALRFVPFVVAALGACEPPTPTNPDVPSSGQFYHGSSDTPCIAGAIRVEVSVYSSSLTVGGATANGYASVYDASGDYISALNVRWYVADTTIARISASDEIGRPIVSAVANGTTEVVADCGTVTGHATVTVTGGNAPPTNTKTVTVTIDDSSLHPGETTRVIAHTTDEEGRPIDVPHASWTSSASSVATVSSQGVVTAVSNGEATITAASSGSVGAASVTVETNTTTPTTPTEPAPPPSDPSSVLAAPPALPQSEPNFRSIPAEARQIRVPPGGDLQAALDNAELGDAILLAPGATYTGNFILRNKGGFGSCPAWITVRTDGSLPSPGQRVTPATAASLAKIFTPDVQPAIRTEPRASCYRITGLEVALPSWLTVYNYGIVWLGDGGWVAAGEKQVTLDLVPTNIVLDRLYIHGQSGSNFSRCVALNSANTAIIDSWISDCHSTANDAQAIAGWNGPGPYLIENNHLAGATENIMFGGADPGISGLIPSDITIRRNHFYKDPAWKGRWLVKNLFELKNARRVLVEGNVFENNWADGQSGMAIVIKSQTGNEAGRLLWQGTTDVTFRYNIVRNSPRAFNLQAVGEGGSDRHVARVRAEHNLFENIGSFNGTGGDGWHVLLTHHLRDVKLSHNTFVHNTGFGTALYLAYADGGAARNITITDNVFTSPVGYGIAYSDTRVGTESIKAFAGSTWQFDRNVIGGVETLFAPWHPPGNWYLPTVAGIGFVNAQAGEYRLSDLMPFKGRGDGGSDPGVDLVRLRSETNGVVVR